MSTGDGRKNPPAKRMINEFKAPDTSAIDAALHEVQQAQAELRKLQAVYSKGSTYHTQCEVIDNHLHDALNILGNHRG